MAGLLERRVRAPWGLKWTSRRDLSARLGVDLADMVVALADLAYPALAGDIPPTRRGAHHLLRIGAYAVALHEALVDNDRHVLRGASPV